MVSVCTVPARGGRSCEHFGGYKTINRIPLSEMLTDTVEHIYDACPKYSEWGSFPLKRVFKLATVAAADSASTVRKKYSVFIYSEAEPHAMYAIYKQTLTLCVLQY